MTRERLGWHSLPPAAQLYVMIVVAAGACTAVAFAPHSRPPAGPFLALVAIACVMSTWKVNLPIPLSSGSTLSMSYAADLAALLLVGPRQAMFVALAGAYTQCTSNVKRSYPLYRTAFSLAAEAITMGATSAAYEALGGSTAPTEFAALPKPLVGAIAAYFVVNTSLVAGAIGLSSRRPIVQIWIDDFLWSGASFMVAGSAGACAAVLAARGQIWTSFLLAMPTYVVYRSYSLFVARLDEERRHLQETTRLHEEAVRALRHAQESEQALAEEKARLVVVLGSIGDGVIATDLDGTVLLMNAAAAAMTGWPCGEAIGRPLAIVFQTADPETRKRFETETLLLRDSSSPAASRRPATLIARDLSERRIEECAAPLRDGGEQTIGLVVAFRDITDALRVQEERARADRLASLGLLAGGIAHDFNNVLMAIMGNISMARAATGTMNGGALADAEQACVRARQITWQLQTFAKGGVPLKKPVALKRVLEESATLALRGSNAACDFDVPDDLWTIEADECQLVQVFMNVLLNAQQAMPHGGTITVRAENVFELTERSQHTLRVGPGPYVRVAVVDAGIGIPRDHLSRIFDPYFGTKQRGSGLGLATAHSIVKHHGGFIGVESEQGRGTTMTIHFPAALAAAARGATPAALSSRDRSLHDRPCVLVMDDEASARTLAANMLEFLGYSVEVVDTGSAAIARFEQALGTGRPFDAVMLDLVVPGDLGAREAMDRLTTLYPAARGILVTGYAQEGSVAAYRDHGFAAAITKPFTLQELQTTMQSVITSAPWRVH